MTWLLLTPALLLMALVFGWPMLRYAWLSFHADSVLTGLVPVANGGANWLRLLADDRFWQDVLQTSRFALVSVTAELGLALLIALLLDQRQCALDVVARLVPLTQEGMQQRAVRQRTRVGPVGSHHLIAAAEGLVQFAQIELLQTGLGCQLCVRYPIGRC